MNESEFESRGYVGCFGGSVARNAFCNGSWEALLPLLNFTFHLAGGVTWQLQTNAQRAFCFHLTLTSCEGLQHHRKKIFPLSMTSPSQEWRKGGGRQEQERRRRGWHSWWQPQYHLLLTNSSCCFTYTPTTQQQANEWEACCRGPPRLQRFLIDNCSHLLHYFTLMWFLKALCFTSHLQLSPLGRSKSPECWGYIVVDSCCYFFMWHWRHVLTRCKVTSYQQQVISLSTVKMKDFNILNPTTVFEIWISGNLDISG